MNPNVQAMKDLKLTGIMYQQSPLHSDFRELSKGQLEKQRTSLRNVYIRMIV